MGLALPNRGSVYHSIIWIYVLWIIFSVTQSNKSNYLSIIFPVTVPLPDDQRGAFMNCFEQISKSTLSLI